MANGFAYGNAEWVSYSVLDAIMTTITQMTLLLLLFYLLLVKTDISNVLIPLHRLRIQLLSMFLACCFTFR